MIFLNRVIYRASTIKFIFRILSKYKNLAFNKNEKRYSKLCKTSKEQISYNSPNPVHEDQSFLGNLIYKNEDWEVIKNRFHDRLLKFFNLPLNTVDNACSDNKIKIVSKDLYFRSIGLKDDWIYFYLNEPSLKNYELKFKAVFNSKFREIQFGFRYIDFYNRYRFRIEDNLLHFDIVKKGQFYNSLHTEPLFIKVEESYNFLIVVVDEKFSFLCNGTVIMTVTDHLKLFRIGAVALILWDDSGNSNIQGVFKNVSFNSIS